MRIEHFLACSEPLIFLAKHSLLGYHLTVQNRHTVLRAIARLLPLTHAGRLHIRVVPFPHSFRSRPNKRNPIRFLGSILPRILSKDFFVFANANIGLRSLSTALGAYDKLFQATMRHTLADAASPEHGVLASFHHFVYHQPL